MVSFSTNVALIDEVLLPNLKQGKNHYSKNISNLTDGSVYFISLETSLEQVTHKLIVSE